MRLISISGNIGAGKDTFGKILADLSGFEVIKFATKLREQVYSYHNLPPTLMGDRSFEGTIIESLGDPHTVRGWLQYWGSHKRANNPQYWIDLLHDSLEDADGYIVTDTRYPNEFGWIKYQDGISIYIKRDDTQNLVKHESESYQTYLEKTADFVVENSTKEELKNSAIKILRQFSWFKKPVLVAS